MQVRDRSKGLNAIPSGAESGMQLQAAQPLQAVEEAAVSRGIPAQAATLAAPEWLWHQAYDYDTQAIYYYRESTRVCLTPRYAEPDCKAAQLEPCCFLWLPSKRECEELSWCMHISLRALTLLGSVQTTCIRLEACQSLSDLLVTSCLLLAVQIQHHVLEHGHECTQHLRSYCICPQSYKPDVPLRKRNGKSLQRATYQLPGLSTPLHGTSTLQRQICSSCRKPSTLMRLQQSQRSLQSSCLMVRQLQTPPVHSRANLKTQPPAHQWKLQRKLSARPMHERKSSFRMPLALSMHQAADSSRMPGLKPQASSRSSRQLEAATSASLTPPVTAQSAVCSPCSWKAVPVDSFPQWSSVRRPAATALAASHMGMTQAPTKRTMVSWTLQSLTWQPKMLLHTPVERRSPAGSPGRRSPRLSARMSQRLSGTTGPGAAWCGTGCSGTACGSATMRASSWTRKAGILSRLKL